MEPVAAVRAADTAQARPQVVAAVFPEAVAAFRPDQAAIRGAVVAEAVAAGTTKLLAISD